MSGDIIAQVIYLGFLGLLLSVGLWTRSRKNLSQTAQHAAIWVLIFIAAIAAFGVWGDVERHLGQQSAQGDQIRVPVNRDGHYYLRLNLNDIPVDFVVDTGATDIVLSAQDARRIGIDVDNLAYFGRAQTANGTVQTANVTLETVQLGDITDYDVRAVVNGGELFGSLLGMGYLQRWGRIEISGDVLSLTR
jgi:aspartyl protease family protein